MNINNLVFVYGSLKTGGNIRGLDSFEGTEIVGKATTTYPDYNMLDLGSFPGVTMKGTYKIQGEVWRCDDEVLADLNSIEGYTEFYNRIRTESTEGRAWMYYLESDQYQSLTYPESSNIGLQQDVLYWKLF